MHPRCVLLLFQDRQGFQKRHWPYPKDHKEHRLSHDPLRQQPPKQGNQLQPHRVCRISLHLDYQT